MEVSTASFQSTNGFGQPNTFTSSDIGAMDVDIKDDMDIDLTGDAELLGLQSEATVPVSWRTVGFITRVYR